MQSLDEILLPYQKAFCNDDFPRKIVLKARQIGFSFMLAYSCIKKSLLNPKSLSVLLSINERSSQELLKKCKQWAEAAKVMLNGAIDYEPSATEIRFSNGSRVCSLPGGNPNAGRGLTVTGVLGIDEFAYVPNIEDVWQGVVPTMTNRFAGVQPDIIIGSTPHNIHSLFGKIWQEDSNFKHYSIDIYTAIKQGLPVDLEEIRKLIPDPEQFSVEYECKWANTQGSLLDTCILDFYDYDGSHGKTYYVGIDFGYRNDATAIAVLRLENGIVFVENIVILHHTDFSKQFEIIKELHQKYNFFAGYCDQNGIGAAISEQISKEICTKIKGYQTTAANKTPNYEYLRNQVFNHKIKFSGQYKDIVIQDFNNVQKTISGSGKITYTALRAGGMHSDVTSAIVLGLQAVKDNPLQTSMPSPFMSASKFGAPRFQTTWPTFQRRF